MFSLKQIERKSLGAILLSCLAATPALAELSIEEVNSIARQTTVVIAPGLTQELVEELENNRNNPLARKGNPDGVWNPGSGVIIARQGKTHYALTVTHNFRQRHLEQNLFYGVFLELQRKAEELKAELEKTDDRVEDIDERIDDLFLKRQERMIHLPHPQ